MLALTKKDIETLIFVAAKKLNKYQDFVDDQNALNDAMSYFEKNTKRHHSASELSNIALLSVLNVYIPGALRPVVRYNWGNLTAVPDLSPFTGGSGGGSMLDQVNRTDYIRGEDDLGVEARVIANYLMAGEFDADFIEYLKGNGILTEQPKRNVPKPDV